MPSHSVKQARVMSAIAHGWRPTGKAAGIPVSVAKEFHAADKGKKYGKGMEEGGRADEFPLPRPDPRGPPVVIDNRGRKPRQTKPEPAWNVDWGPYGKYKFARGGMLARLDKPAFSPRFGEGLGRRMSFPKMGKFQRMYGGGFIDSTVPGRTDKHNLFVQSGSYVLPADHVSAIGQNNSIAGADVIKRMFGTGSKFGGRIAVPRFAGGGGVGQDVPVVVAGGEVILPPGTVRRIGNGNVEKGHSILARWVLETRKKHISRLKSLKPPKGADE